MAQKPAPQTIGRSLRGQRIFVTGATGFIGKVLIEKLLWSVPQVGKLVLLVRPTSERSPAERLRREVLDSPMMARLRSLHADGWESWVADRLDVVAGDLARHHFGLEAAQYAQLCSSVDRIVACAATVSFDERLDRALDLNARGAQRTLDLAHDAGDVPLVHVSTCFVSGDRRGPVTERLPLPETPVTPAGAAAQPQLDPDTLLASLEAACQDSDGSSRALVEAGARLARDHGFHDVYTLTKALGERLIAAGRGRVPLAIVRPAIVESALSEPIPGWIDGVRVADPLLAAYGRGLIRDFPGARDQNMQIVPVDHVVNAIIAALARLPGDSGASAEGSGPRIYQVASTRNPITLGELVSWARAGFRRSPLADEAGLPIDLPEPRFVPPDRYLRRLRGRHSLTRRLGRWLRASRLVKRSGAADRTLEHFTRLFEIYRPYLEHGAVYDDTATCELWHSMSAADRLAFPFDVAAVDWPSYVAGVHIPGLVKFALKAESGSPLPAPPDDPVAAAHARGEFVAARATTVDRLFDAAVAADSEAIAFQTYREGRWLRYTYGQARTATLNIAGRLRARYQIQRGDRVALWGSASPEWVLTSFAVHRLGAVTVPLDPQWPAEEVLEAARFVGAKLICAAPSLSAKLTEGDLAGLPKSVVELSAPFVPEPDVGRLPGYEADESCAQPEDLASIHFTSGTTVAPKAVPLTHRNLLANVRDLVPVMASSRQRLLSVLPIHHVFEFTVGLLVPLVGGGTISYVSQLKPAEISWMMNATRPTMLVAVPRLLDLLHGGIRQSIEAGGPALGFLFRVLFGLSALSGGRAGRLLFGKVHRRFGGALRRIATGGSALEPSLGRSFRLMGFQVAEGYGMTETSPVLTVNPWNATRFGTVGRPLPGVEIALRPVPGAAPGSGQIWVRGANVMAGYYRNPEASLEALEDGWLNTGDIGSFDAKGYLRIAGRTKDVIVTSAGKNVYPEEVEHRYRGVPGVSELVVLALPTEGGGECVGAVVVPPTDATAAEVEAVRASIAERSSQVPSYQRIARLEIWRGELPKTTTLKVQRGRLREAVLAGSAEMRQASPEPPVEAPGATAPDETERWVRTTLARLTRSRPDVLRASDHLAELGVDSLARVELLAQIEERFDLSIDDDSAAALSRVQDVLALVQPSRPAMTPQP